MSDSEKPEGGRRVVQRGAETLQGGAGWRTLLRRRHESCRALLSSWEPYRAGVRVVGGCGASQTRRSLRVGAGWRSAAQRRCRVAQGGARCCDAGMSHAELC